jgi:hypothetical protein
VTLSAFEAENQPFLALALYSIYRVAAIFPDQFQGFTDASKNRIFINYFAQNHLSRMP